MDIETIKKASMYIPVLGIIAVVAYGCRYIKDYGVHFWCSAFVQAVSTVALLAILFSTYSK